MLFKNLHSKSEYRKVLAVVVKRRHPVDDRYKTEIVFSHAKTQPAFMSTLSSEFQSSSVMLRAVCVAQNRTNRYYRIYSLHGSVIRYLLRLFA